MSARSGYPIKAINQPGVVMIAGGFVTNGGSAPTTTSGGANTTGGAKWSVGAPTAAGVYTITLQDGPFAGVVALLCNIEAPALNSTAGARIGLRSVTTAGTFTIVTSSVAGTDAQITGLWVSFTAILRDTSIVR